MLYFLILGFLLGSSISPSMAAKKKPAKAATFKKAPKLIKKKAAPQNPPKQVETLADQTSEFKGVTLPESQAGYILLVEEETGRVLLERKSREMMAPSSMTKILTAYTVYRLLKEFPNFTMQSELIVSQNAMKQEGSSMFLKAGQSVSIEKLLEGLIVVSGNDAGVTLAEGICGGEEIFTQHMNRYIKEMGLEATHFVNTSGLPHPNHYTTCADLRKASNELMKRFPQEYKIFGIERYEFNKVKQTNRNPLLGWAPYFCDGVKTGSTDQAGYSLVGSCLSTPTQDLTNNTWRLTIVLNGLKSKYDRATESKKLVNWAFQNFQKLSKLWASNIPVIKGGVQEVRIGAHISTVVPKWEKLKVKIQHCGFVSGNLPQGTKVGTIEVSCGAFREPYIIPIVTLSDTKNASFARKAWDGIQSAFSKSPADIELHEEINPE